MFLKQKQTQTTKTTQPRPQVSSVKCSIWRFNMTNYWADNVILTPSVQYDSLAADKYGELCVWSYPIRNGEIFWMNSKSIFPCSPYMVSVRVTSKLEASGDFFFRIRILENVSSPGKKQTNKQTKKPQQFDWKFIAKHIKIHETKIPQPATSLTKEDKYCFIMIAKPFADWQPAVHPT